MSNKTAASAPPVEGRERIIQAAFQLFAERGFYGVSISDVAEAAGLVKSSIYHHFENKEALYLAVLSETCDSISAEMDTCAQGNRWQTRLHQAMLALARAMGPKSQSLGLIMQGISHAPSSTKQNRQIVSTLRQKMAAVITREIANGIRAGDLKPLDLELTTTCLIGLVVSVLQADQVGTEEERITFALDLFLQGARRRKS